MMRWLVRAYDGLIHALPVLSGAFVLIIVVSIVYDVVVRELGVHPPQWTTALVEYSLLYMTMLAAPWLVRQHGHIVVDTLHNFLSAGARRYAEVLVSIICAIISIIIVYYGSILAVKAWQYNDYDIRSIPIPYWIFYGVIPFGFFFIAIEFILIACGRGRLRQAS